MPTNLFDDAVSHYTSASGRESCQQLSRQVSQPIDPPYVMRVTGGCLVDDKYQKGLNYLQWALTGGVNNRTDLPRFAGFAW